jgi:1-pyrroline-5-carboxylate dehydrogenase
MSFKLTYSTMFDPPEEMHSSFETALAEVRENLGATYSMYIDGQDVPVDQTAENRSPVDRRQVLGHFPVGDENDVDRAMAAANRAFQTWRMTPHEERLRLVRRAAELIEDRVYHIGAALALEVGKNRMESLGEAQETADFFSGYAAEFERNQAYDLALPDDPLPDWRSHNRTILKPHGVWGVVVPFNFPLALGGGPLAAALVTGNTVVLKGATDTPWAGRLLADCIRDAGFPDGVFNYVTGPGRVVGEALINHPDLAGVTFTGSHEVGMHLYRIMAGGAYPRPCITEMGGKNACIVTANGDLERAVPGIVRSAYGLTGQKCSALSRVYVEEGVADELLGRVVEAAKAVTVGDPCQREIWMGPVINEAAARNFERYCAEIKANGGSILLGGDRLSEGDFAHGNFAACTVAEAAAEHPLFQEEMFVPILMVCRVKNVKEGVALANQSSLGLTAGCYGDEEEVRYFLDNIEAGVIYANRPQGATTGAWPGYQAFGGWKGSGSTGKAIGSYYYLPLYLREQSQTVVE